MSELIERLRDVITDIRDVERDRGQDLIRHREYVIAEAAKCDAVLHSVIAELETNQIPGRCRECRWCYPDCDVWRCMTGGHRLVTLEGFCDRWEATP
jgi:hypothetical protein